MKTHTQYLEELEKHYEKNPPGFDNTGRPRYWFRDQKTGKEKVCAIGFAMKSPRRFTGLHGDIDDLNRNTGDNGVMKHLYFLKPEYRNLDVCFLLEVQHWHDTASNWKRGKLTDVGQQEFQELKDKACWLDEGPLNF